jgi:hypothetical protein
VNSQSGWELSWIKCRRVTTTILRRKAQHQRYARNGRARAALAQCAVVAADWSNNDREWPFDLAKFAHSLFPSLRENDNFGE